MMLTLSGCLRLINKSANLLDNRDLKINSLKKLIKYQQITLNEQRDIIYVLEAKIANMQKVSALIYDSSKRCCI